MVETFISAEGEKHLRSSFIINQFLFQICYWNGQKQMTDHAGREVWNKTFTFSLNFIKTLILFLQLFCFARHRTSVVTEVTDSVNGHFLSCRFSPLCRIHSSKQLSLYLIISISTWQWSTSQEDKKSNLFLQPKCRNF